MEIKHDNKKGHKVGRMGMQKATARKVDKVHVPEYHKNPKRKQSNFTYMGD